VKENKDNKPKIIDIKTNDFKKLGIKIFENKDIKIKWFNIETVIISNAYLITLKYVPVDSDYWYQYLYTLKSKEEIETFTLDVIKHVI